MNGSDRLLTIAPVQHSLEWAHQHYQRAKQVWDTSAQHRHLQQDLIKLDTQIKQARAHLAVVVAQKLRLRSSLAHPVLGTEAELQARYNQWHGYEMRLVKALRQAEAQLKAEQNVASLEIQQVLSELETDYQQLLAEYGLLPVERAVFQHHWQALRVRLSHWRPTVS